MRVALGVVLTALWLVYAGQVLSVIDFRLAQRLGLQERPAHADPLSSHLELWTARFDTLWLWTLPAAGVLMLLDHSWWPYAAMVGGGAFIDAGGRELSKITALREQGVRIGNPAEHRNMKILFTTMIVLGATAIVTGLAEAT